MSRIRSIHPGFWTDETLAGLSDAAALFFIGLMTEADDAGAFEWKPTTLRMRLRPTKDGAVDPLLDELEAANVICRYAIGGRLYGAIRNFCKYQRPKFPKIVHPSSSEIADYVASKVLATPADDSSTPSPTVAERVELPPIPRNAEMSPQMKLRREEGEREETNPEREKPFPSLAPSQASGAAVLKLVSDEAGIPEIPAILDRRAYPEAFEALWADYRPIASPNATKADAHRTWAKLSASDREACWVGLVRYAVWVAEENTKRADAKRSPVEVKHLATFINRRGWEPFMEPEDADAVAG